MGCNGDPNGVSCLSGFYIYMCMCMYVCIMCVCVCVCVCVYILDIDPRSVIINSAEIFLMHHSTHNAKVCDNILNNRFHSRKEENTTTHLALQSVHMS
jgi:hypothetical protein